MHCISKRSPVNQSARVDAFLASVCLLRFCNGPMPKLMLHLIDAEASFQFAPQKYDFLFYFSHSTLMKSGCEYTSWFSKYF